MAEEEVSLEGILKSILVNHRDDEVTGLLVLVFKGEEASVYNSGIKPEVVESIGELLGPQN